MDTDSKMDVADWRDSPLPIIPRAGARRSSLPPTVIGIAGTLLLHGMLIQSVAFVSRGPRPKPPEAQESANALPKSTADADSLVLISLPMMASASQAASQTEISSLPDLSKMKIKSPINADPPEFLSLETLALSEDQASNAALSGADGAEQARLFGIYTGQIQARIDRVWRRPRTPVNEGATSVDTEESFQCEAQVVQDIRGNVQEILLPRCNGSPAWQHSLVLAIQQSSPLPAPPSARVFQTSITLSFVGIEYRVSESQDGYEFEQRKIVQSN